MDSRNILQKIQLRKISKNHILIAFLTGILLLIISVPTSENDEEKSEGGEVISVNSSMTYIEYIENHLEKILSKMEGAGEVSVMVTLETSAEQVVEKDVELQEDTVSESDLEGGNHATIQSTRSETTVLADEESGNPYVSKEIAPQIEGILVIAEGGGSAVVVKNITEAVEALFGIETHKIKVVKKGG